MNKNKKYTWCMLLMLAVMCLCFTACNNEDAEGTLNSAEGPTIIPAVREEQKGTPDSSEGVPSASPTVTPTDGAPLIAGCAPFDQKFSPYFAESESDVDVTAMTQLKLLTVDRDGNVVYNAIQGQTIEYNGSAYEYKGIADLSVDYDAESGITTYSATIRDDIVFSDGVKMTADDIIFNYYVYLDPGYRGPNTLKSYDIVGLRNYQTQTTPEIYNKYNTKAKAIYTAGPTHIHSDADEWTAEEQETFWREIDKAWNVHAGLIVEYVNDNYASYADEGWCGPYTSAEVAENEGLRVAFGMAMWRFGKIDENGICTGMITGNTWDMNAGQYPTPEDFAKETQIAYGHNPEVYFEKEGIGENEPDVLKSATTAFITLMAASEPELVDGIASISGIRKTGEYSVEIQVNGYSATDIYGVFGISIAPLHYYGDLTLYDYENNQFGFVFGAFQLSAEQQAKPLGAGPYKYVKYEDGVVYFEANENYRLGSPKIRQVQFMEMETDEIPAAIQDGRIDVGTVIGSKEKFQEIQSYNSNAEVSGDIITTAKVSKQGYGYIGICADNVFVGGEPASEASKNLRRAIAAVVAVYRDDIIEAYFDEAADVIRYPGFGGSQEVLPTSEEEDKYAAAMMAAVEYFKAAGYTYDEETGKLSGVPSGAKLSYEAAVPGKSVSEHPAFEIFEKASAALATIGFELKIRAYSDTEAFWSRLENGTVEIWAAAWSVGVVPDLYQMYHSSGIADENGYDSNPYHICDKELDESLLLARMSSDGSERKSLFRECYDYVADWAVEIPLYQKWDAVIFSTERINMDTLAPDITVFRSWMDSVELLEMK